MTETPRVSSAYVRKHFRGVARLRAWWRFVVLGYRYEVCQGCGRPVEVVWHTDDVLWQEVKGAEDVLCVRCFDRRCASRGVILTWEPRELVRADARS